MTSGDLELMLLLHNEDTDVVGRFAAALAAAWPRERSGRVSIVDNASSNSVAESARAALGRVIREVPVRVLTLERNIGFARAVNLVLGQSTATYLAVFNPDGELEPETIRRLIAALEVEPRALVAGADLVAFGAETPSPAASIERDWCPGGAGVYRTELWLALAALIRSSSSGARTWILACARGREDFSTCTFQERCSAMRSEIEAVDACSAVTGSTRSTSWPGSTSTRAGSRAQRGSSSCTGGRSGTSFSSTAARQRQAGC